MRANYKLKRLFIDASLSADAPVEATREQTHYLRTVLRLEEGAELLVFNGRDGEWRARLAAPSKKAALLVPVALERAQPERPTLLFCFAPIKAGRLDWMVEKAVEMGAGTIQPVITRFTQNRRISRDKMEAWVLDAAQQCGVLALPDVRDAVDLDMLLDEWDDRRTLIFCDEASGTNNPKSLLEGLGSGPLGVLTGPEGGFSDDEREKLAALSFVRAIPLGPRILRADTAAVAALTAVQMIAGDWQ